jgi:hypothetical protein
MNRSKLLASVARMFKAMPDDAVADLEDVFEKANLGDGPVPGVDQWNADDILKPLREKLGLSVSQEAMSGGGAETMVARYSADTQPGNSVNVRYAELARIIAAVVDKVTDLEKSNGQNGKAITAIAELLSTGMRKNERFPASEAKRAGEEDDERDEEREDEKDEAAKAATVHVSSVPEMMRALMGLSRGSGTSGLAVPPDFGTALLKATPMSIEHFSFEEQNDVSAVRQLLGHVAAGRVDSNVVKHRLYRCSDRVKSMFS